MSGFSREQRNDPAAQYRAYWQTHKLLPKPS
jgi:hypothetical protein